MNFHDNLKEKAHKYIKQVYRVSKEFPKDEMYGVTSQLRRSAMSVMLNYIEGYARRRSDECKTYRHFLEISYGSLKESKYLVYFSYTENYLKKEEYEKILNLADDLGRMIWGLLSKIK